MIKTVCHHGLLNVCIIVGNEVLPSIGKSQKGKSHVAPLCIPWWNEYVAEK